MISLTKTSIDLDPLFLEIALFLESSNRNTYVQDDIIRLYIRKSERFYKGKIYSCFDIANVEITDPDHRNKGYFSAFLKKFMEVYPTKNIFVESILNPILIKKLKSFNFIEDKSEDGLQLNMFLIK